MYEESIQEKIDKVVTSFENEYEFYMFCGNNALEKDNISSAQIHFAEASGFARARWILEYIFYGDF